MNTRCILFIVLLTSHGWSTWRAEAQLVAVTMKFDSPTIAPGAGTTLRVFAEVIPGERASSERIFSWYVDLLNPGPSVAEADFSQLVKTASDNNPKTSSYGTTQGANRRGIYDTFINDIPLSKTGTGVNTPVELFNVPVQGVSTGQVTFRVAAGSGVPSLAADFIVAPIDGGDPMLGGVYDAATAVLQVSGSAPCIPTLDAVYAPLAGGKNRITLSFAPCPGQNTVEYRDQLGSGSWQALPGAPHNSGLVTDTNAVASRFYRIRVSP